jgi:DNA transformation protein
MAVQADFIAHCAELLSGLGRVRTTRMFGGCGLYVDDIFIALIAGDTLYLKTDEQTQEAFAAVGSAPFEYTAKGEVHSTSYWSVPADAMDSPALMKPRAELARAAALRKGAPGKKKVKASMGRAR